jgi:hypothetical protein
MFSGSDFSHDKRTLLTVEKNVFLGHSTPASPSTALSPHRSGLSTGNPHQHRQKEEDPHLHIRDRYKSKA